MQSSMKARGLIPGWEAGRGTMGTEEDLQAGNALAATATTKRKLVIRELKSILT